jgi:hypothetical protein
MIFYHIELAKVEKINNFVPRIPYYIMDMEDVTIPRICVSNTIEGCLSAAPWGGLTLEAHPLGMLYRVYVFETNNYMKPEVLAKEYGVLDAIINQEYWLLDEIKPIDDFLIDIQGYTYGTGIMINGKEHTLIENLKYEIIKWAKEKGLKNYVLGGGYGADDGIYQYKYALAPHGQCEFYIGRKTFDQSSYDHLVALRKEELNEKYFPLYRS